MGYMVRFTRSNSAKGETSYNPRTMSGVWQRSAVPKGSRTSVQCRTWACLSAVFGMGTGVSRPLWPPAPSYADKRVTLWISPGCKLHRAKEDGMGLLVAADWTPRFPLVRTSRLYQTHLLWASHRGLLFGWSFGLRCFQPLSLSA